MTLVLIAVFVNILSTSLQEEDLSGLRPAHIYNGGVSKVIESENVTFKCHFADSTVSTVYIYLFKNGEKVMMDSFQDAKRDDTKFNITSVTVEHSGSYTCLYSEQSLNVSKTNATGNNSISLQVLGKFLPAKLKITNPLETMEETLALTCSLTHNQNCTEVYIYLCLNGIRLRKQRVKCGDLIISTTFLLEKSSGSYSCVYSVSDYNLNEVNVTGENTIFIQECNRDGFGLLSLIISAFGGVLVVLLVVMGFFYCQGICSFRPDHTARFSTMRSEKVRSAGRKIENYEQPEVKNAVQTIDVPCYDSIKGPYATVQKSEDKTRNEQVMQSFSCKGNSMYSMVSQ
ncbi:uncharacterized protein LOC124396068 isoform X5 [Silurus meridionalis]|uniref:uncharacterized protein LOC124396068 isoform X5 n=1 Tax=Silurus meridionalis TaxID=175797 RepID=UPI001EEA4005|nr:uncharacterized protein LOC124396068 isoform X5 [Silurus meridionalis]